MNCKDPDKAHKLCFGDCDKMCRRTNKLVEVPKPTKESVREALESGFTLHYHVWYFTRYGMGCEMDCCNESFRTLDEAVDTTWDFIKEELDEVIISE